MTIKNKACIVGVYEHPTRKAPDRSVAQLHAESARGALLDAGLTKDDIDGYFCAGDAPGLGVVYATLIPNVESYSDVENPIVTEFQVFGSTVGGQEVWSNWFTYPIYLEDLVYYPSESIDDTTGLCTGGTNEDLPCAPGQDDPLPCSYCLDQSFCLNPASS